MGDEERATFGHLVDVTLSEDEIKSQLERNADIDRKMLLIKAEKAAANSGFNEDLKTLRKEQVTLLESVSSGKTKLEISCYLERDDRRGIMLTRKADGGEIVDERALTADELNEDKQGDLFASKAPGELTGAGNGDSDDEDEQESDPDLENVLDEYEASRGSDASAEASGLDDEEPKVVN